MLPILRKKPLDGVDEGEVGSETSKTRAHWQLCIVECKEPESKDKRPLSHFLEFSKVVAHLKSEK
eukprot:3472521-Amphidinium_carterae.1